MLLSACLFLFVLDWQSLVFFAVYSMYTHNIHILALVCVLIVSYSISLLVTQFHCCLIITSFLSTLTMSWKFSFCLTHTCTCTYTCTRTLHCDKVILPYLKKELSPYNVYTIFNHLLCSVYCFRTCILYTIVKYIM